MTDSEAPETNAKLLVKLLVANEYEQGDQVPDAHLRELATEAGMEDVYDDALAFAFDERWFEQAGPGAFSITTDGWENGNA